MTRSLILYSSIKAGVQLKATEQGSWLAPKTQGMQDYLALLCLSLCEYQQLSRLQQCAIVHPPVPQLQSFSQMGE
jgi:hypothetical protein